jgi:hypothetical protein
MFVPFKQSNSHYTLTQKYWIMIKNIGKTSSTLRIVTGLTFLALFVFHIIGGIVGLSLFSISGVLLISGFTRSCPLVYYAREMKINI